MKRVRCPKCDEYITFDESRYEEGQALVFQCPACGKQFGVRMGVTKLRDPQKTENQANRGEAAATGTSEELGSIVVIENVFHYKQVIPLKMGDNVIGRYQKGNKVNTPIETVDPSVDLRHCVINVSRKANGKLKYTLTDGPSATGTFVDNEILADRERRIVGDGTLITIGATTIILRAGGTQDESL